MSNGLDAARAVAVLRAVADDSATMPWRAANIARSRVPGPVALRSTHGLSSWLARVAVTSLYDELALYPKPGLVSLRDAGAHDDMDARTFLRSIFALRGYFRDVTDAGIRGAAFGEMKALGIAAEARMLRATRGANTHRGAIFSMGLLCAAAGWVLSHGATPDDATLRAALRRWRRDLEAPSPIDDARSHGFVAGLRHGVPGAKGEAARAFPSVFEHALPALRAALARGADPRRAQLHALFTLMAQVADTNVLYRGGREGMDIVRTGARQFLAQGSVFAPRSMARAGELHERCCVLGLSPGGCADLLGVTLVVHRLQRDAHPGRHGDPAMAAQQDARPGAHAR